MRQIHIRKSFRLWKKVVNSIIILLLIASSLSLPCLVSAEHSLDPVLRLEDGQKNYSLQKYMYFAEDEGRKLSFATLQENQTLLDFQRSDQPYSFAYTSNAYWVKIAVENQTEETNWLLEVMSPTMDHIDFFLVAKADPEQRFIHKEAGDLFPFAQRESVHRNFIFHLVLEPAEEYQLWLRFETEGSMQFPLKLYTNEGFFQKSTSEYLLFGFYYGIALVMAVYNLFLGFSLKEKSYFFYVCFVLSNSLTHFTFNGLAYEYLWPDYVWWNNRSIIFFLSLSNAFALAFASSFLQSKKYSIFLYRLLKLSIVSQLLLLLLLFINYPLALKLTMISLFILSCMVIGSGAYIYLKGFKPARFFLLGWGIFVTGIIITALTDMGFLPITYWHKYASQITFGLEVILFSLALVDRIYILRREKEQAQAKVQTMQEQMIAELQKMDKLKDDFLAKTSHELRTPLHGIMGITQSIQAGIAGEVARPLRQQLALIESSSARLLHLVNDILDFSKLHHQQLQLVKKSISLKEVLEAVVAVLKPTVMHKPLEIMLDLPEQLANVEADQQRLQQILYNLLGNALKFTDAGKVEIHVQETKDYVFIRISDTGKGITAEEAKDIFVEYFQGNEQDKWDGTGLGLSISKQLIELHGGALQFFSEPGVGSTFQFSLPKSKGNEKTEQGQQDSRQQIHPKTDYLSLVKALEVPVGEFAFQQVAVSSEVKGKILVADDESINLQVLVNLLSLQGFAVVTVSDGEEVIAKLQEEQGFSMVIVDVMIPKKTGYDICRWIRSKYSPEELPVLVLTARGGEKDKQAAFEAGANDYLLKPVEKNELLARVHALIAASQAEALRRLNSELTRMEESRRLLLTNISHELGTPLTAIQGYVQALLDQVIDSSSYHKYFQIIQEKVFLINRLITDLFELSKLETRKVSFHFQQKNLLHYLSQVERKYKMDVQEKGLTLEIQPLQLPSSALVPSIRVDVDRMDQVFTNLIFNALRYTPQGGKITILTEILWDEGEVLFQVKDTGVGIAEELLPFIFDRFYSDKSKSATGGTGLGLAICKGIIEQHQGRIWATSQPNQGTTFFFTLSLYR